MKFEKEEMPHADNVVTPRSLRKGEIFFDEDCILWMMSSEEHRKYGLKRDVWLIPSKQLVYSNSNAKGIGKLQTRLVECLLEFKDGDLIPIYAPEDIIQAVEKYTDKYIGR